MLKELYFYFKKYKFITFGIYIQTTLILMLLGAFFVFSQYLDTESILLKEKYNGKAIFQMTNDYYENKGEKFYKNPNALNITKNFYNALNNQSKFKFMPLNNQAVYINEPVEDIFYDGYENGNDPDMYDLNGEKYCAVKSFQLNKQSYDFFNLPIAEGRGFKEVDFEDNDSNTIPIILGSSYKQNYKINDIIQLDYVGGYFNGKVMGFLDTNVEILSNQSPQTNLNNYIILPHIDFNDPKSKEEYAFQITIYMRRISAFLLTEDDTNKINEMRNEVEYISQKTGFKEYLFFGEHMYISEYKNIISLLKENTLLINVILTLIFILNTIILALIIYLQNKKRTSYYALHYMLGSSKELIFLRQWFEIISIFVLSYITYKVVMSIIFNLIDLKINIILFIFLLILSLLITIISSYKIIHKSINTHLNS